MSNRDLRARILSLEDEVREWRDAFETASAHFYVTYMAGMGYETDDQFEPPAEKPWTDVARRVSTLRGQTTEAGADEIAATADAFAEAIDALAESRGL